MSRWAGRRAGRHMEAGSKLPAYRACPAYRGQARWAGSAFSPTVQPPPMDMCRAQNCIIASLPGTQPQPTCKHHHTGCREVEAHARGRH